MKINNEGRVFCSPYQGACDMGPCNNKCRRKTKRIKNKIRRSWNKLKKMENINETLD